MNRFRPASVSLLLVAAFGTVAFAQEDAPNYIRESATFVVVPDYGPNANNVEVSATTDTPTTLSLATFRQQLIDAYAVGRGGTINFESPLYGDSLVDVDRSGVRAWVTAYVAANPSVSRAQARELAYQPGSGAFDPASRVRVVNRIDRPAADDPLRTQSTAINFDDIVAVYGLRDENRLRLSNGPGTMVEEALASRAEPGLRSADTTNDAFFFGVGVPANTWVPVSGTRAATGFPTVVDFRIDPRDSVVALGITILSFNNFQHWQGTGADPDNANNILVEASFSNGTKQLSTGTTAQSSGGNDVFFGFRAPAGASITGLSFRVVGRNFRALLGWDDLAFITAPAVSYVSSPTSLRGVVGNPFAQIVVAEKSPTAITVTGLPAGLQFDAATGLVSGTPTAAGETDAVFRIANAAGVAELTVRFSIAATPSSIGRPILAPAPSATAILGREFRLPLPTNLDSDPVAALGVSYQTLLYRKRDDGSRVLTSLSSIELAVSDGAIVGTPRRGDSVAGYDLEVIASNADGASRATIALSIFPPIPAPNFDGDAVTDLFFRNPATSTLHGVLLGGYATPNDPERKLTAPASTPIFTIASGVSSAIDVWMGDFNGDVKTDLILHDKGAGRADIVLMNGTRADRRFLFEFGANSPWDILAVAELDNDGAEDVLLRNRTNGDVIAWRMNGADILWAGFVNRQATTARTFVGLGSFTGSANSNLVWANADGTWTIMGIKTRNPNSTIVADLVNFRLPGPAKVERIADLNADGRADIFWRNTATGALSVWLMEGLSVPAAVATGAAENGVVPASLGTPIAGSADTVIAAMADLNGDLRADLVLQSPTSGAYSGVLMAGADRRVITAAPDVMEDGVTQRPQVQRNPDTGQILFGLSTGYLPMLKIAPGGSLQGGVLPAANALADYQVYAQATNALGVPQWTVVGYFAVPTADLSRPVSGRNVWFNGMIRPGEALSDYTIYQRGTGANLNNPDGSPRPRTTLGRPVAQLLNQPLVRAISDTVPGNLAWTPDPSGVDYDFRGKRGFLQQRDLLGRRLVDAQGQPVYVPWRKPDGTTVPVAPGNQPWEFAFDEIVGDSVRTLLAAGNGARIVHQGDFNGDSFNDVLLLDADGRFTMLIMDGLDVLQSLRFTDLPSALVVQSPARFGGAAVGGTPTGFAGWQKRNFGSTIAAEAKAEADPDGDGVANLLEYALGVEDFRAGTPAMPSLSFGADSMKVVLEGAIDDPTLRWEIETTADFRGWSPRVPTVAERSDSTRSIELTQPLPTVQGGWRIKVSLVE